MVHHEAVAFVFDEIRVVITEWRVGTKAGIQVPPVSDGGNRDTFEVFSVRTEELSGVGDGPLCDADNTAEVVWYSIPRAVAVASECSRVGPECSEMPSTRPIKIRKIALEFEPILACHFVSLVRVRIIV